jgi:hypothetical protein
MYVFQSSGICVFVATDRSVTQSHFVRRLFLSSRSSSHGFASLNTTVPVDEVI